MDALEEGDEDEEDEDELLGVTDDDDFDADDLDRLAAQREVRRRDGRQCALFDLNGGEMFQCVFKESELWKMGDATEREGGGQDIHHATCVIHHIGSAA
jgi:hypothetical protein